MLEQMNAFLKEAEAEFEKGKAFETLAKKEGRDLTGEELSSMKNLWVKSQELKDKADEINLLIKARDNQNKYFNEPLRGLMSDVSDPDTKERTSLEEKSTDEQMAIAIEHKAALGSYMRTKSHKLMRKFKTQWDGKIEEKALNRLTDPAGGYLVSTEMRNIMLEKRDQLDEIRPLCEVSATSNAKVELGASADSFVITMAGETVDFTEHTGKIFGKLTFTPHKGNGYVVVSEELLEDTEFNLESYIARRWGIALGKKQLDQWIDGIGVDEPQGVLRASIVDHDIETGTSGTIIPEDIQDFQLQLESQYLTSGTRWVIPTATMSQILLMRSNADGSSTGTFLWQPSFQANIPSTLQGYPVLRVPDSFWPTVDTDGHPLLVFGDWSTYMIVDRTGLTIQRLDEIAALSDEVVFKVKARWDGKASDKNAFARLNRT